MSESFDLATSACSPPAPSASPASASSTCRRRSGDRQWPGRCEKQQVAALGEYLAAAAADLPQPGDIPDSTRSHSSSRSMAEWTVRRRRRRRLRRRRRPHPGRRPTSSSRPTRRATRRRASIRRPRGVRITRGQARRVLATARAMVDGGRPPCPLCGRPTEPRRAHLPAKRHGCTDRMAATGRRPTRSRSSTGRGRVDGRMPWSSNATFLVELSPRRRRGAGDLQAGARRAPAVGLPDGLTGARWRPGSCPRRSAGASCRRPCSATTGRSARARSSCSSRPTSSSTTSRSTRATETSTTLTHDLRLRPAGQQHRPQERALPPRPRRAHLGHRPRPVLLRSTPSCAR